MKHNKKHVFVESVEARELYLFADNESEIYPRVKKAVLWGYSHVKKGDFCPEKAVDAFYYAIEDAARLYFKYHGHKFTTTEKYTAAVLLFNSWADSIQTGDI